MRNKTMVVFPKIVRKKPKWMVIMEHPKNKLDDFGVPLFLEKSIGFPVK